MLNVKDAAKLIGCCPETVRRMRKNGTLTGYKIPGSKAYYFKPSDLRRAFKPVKVEPRDAEALSA